MNRVDVIVPCYNYGHYLAECVESILSQSLSDLRVLIIDDASSDDTPGVARELASRSRRVQYRRHQINIGHIATYNEGLDWAESDYVVLLSADDLLAPGALVRAATLMDARPEVGMIYGSCIKLPIGQPVPVLEPETDQPCWKITPGNALLEYLCAQGSNPIPTPTVVVRTQLQKRVGGYRPELPHSGDLEMWLRFAAHGSAVGEVDAVQAIKRVHSSNMSRQYFDEIIPDLDQKLAAFNSVLHHHGDGLQAASELKKMYTKSISDDAFWRAAHAFDAGNINMCNRLLTYAASIYPEVSTKPEWNRMVLKQRIGPGLWSLLRPLVDGLRGLMQVASPQGASPAPSRRPHE
jgi:glycosyltransferase involved in cell wall biosynthesis